MGHIGQEFGHATCLWSANALSSAASSLVVPRCAGMLWQLQFMVYLCFAVIAGVVASYYFAKTNAAGQRVRKRVCEHCGQANALLQDLPARPISESIHRVVRYHLGSIALGSLIISVVHTLRAILNYMQRVSFCNACKRFVLTQICRRCMAKTVAFSAACSRAQSACCDVSNASSTKSARTVRACCRISRKDPLLGQASCGKPFRATISACRAALRSR